MTAGRREIGSEFWDVPTGERRNDVFPDSVHWFLSGRNALTEIIRTIKRDRPVRTAAMPSWCCDSMIVPFLREGLEVRFYPVYFDGALRQDIDTDCDILFRMDYFGYTADQPVSHPCVIRDVTHSVFSHRYDDAPYIFGSLRKWCGVKTGGFAWGIGTDGDGHDARFAEMRARAMAEKAAYLAGGAGGKGYLAKFSAAEEYLDRLDGAFCGAREDAEAAVRLDVERMRAQRRKNAKVLMDAFPEQLVFPAMSGEDCPLFVPILVPDGRRDDLRRYLIDREIYCPVHWPVSAHHRLSARERVLYDSGLSLVCDQRYTEEDMARVVGTIESFWKEG